ncbi:MAG: aldose 1-epimerase family protein [Flavobacteriales bacterium]|nr:aldose 1-epimerase family protein [Flavobacteriales bacterium]
MNTIISNEKYSATINSKGAELNSLVNKSTDREYIWEGNPEFWGKHSPVLFPIVGALKNDSYKYEGKKYSMSRHGFARDFEFEVLNNDAQSITFELKANTATLQKFPFLFSLKIDYELIENKLVITYYINNNSNKEMPFSIGAHPAFALPNGFTNYCLDFEKEEHLLTHELDSNLFSEATRTIELNETKLPLNYQLFEKDALVFKTIQSKKVTILENNTPLLSVAYDDFQSLGIWTVQNAPFICIEPWIGFADNWNSTGDLFQKEGIRVLNSESEFKAQFSIELFN